MTTKEALILHRNLTRIQAMNLQASLPKTSLMKTKANPKMAVLLMAVAMALQKIPRRVVDVV